jgi:hypothetical protein
MHVTHSDVKEVLFCCALGLEVGFKTEGIRARVYSVHAEAVPGPFIGMVVVAGRQCDAVRSYSALKIKQKVQFTELFAVE